MYQVLLAMLNRLNPLIMVHSLFIHWIIQQLTILIQNTNYENHNDIDIKNEYGAGKSSGWAADGLVKFDISSISSKGIILSATLNFYYYSWGDNNPVGRDLNLYRITSIWKEDTVTWNA